MSILAIIGYVVMLVVCILWFVFMEDMVDILYLGGVGEILYIMAGVVALYLGWYGFLLLGLFLLIFGIIEVFDRNARFAEYAREDKWWDDCRKSEPTLHDVLRYSSWDED